MIIIQKKIIIIHKKAILGFTIGLSGSKGPSRSAAPKSDNIHRKVLMLWMWKSYNLILINYHPIPSSFISNTIIIIMHYSINHLNYNCDYNQYNNYNHNYNYNFYCNKKHQNYNLFKQRTQIMTQKRDTRVYFCIIRVQRTL